MVHPPASTATPHLNTLTQQTEPATSDQTFKSKGTHELQKKLLYILHDDDNSGQAKKLFDTLIDRFIKGHYVFSDRYYTSQKLVYSYKERIFYSPDKKKRWELPKVHADW